MTPETRMKYGLQILGVLVCVGLLSASYTLAYQPLQRQHEENELKQQNVRQLAEKKGIVTARNEQLQKQQKQLKAEVDALAKQIVLYSREHDLLREISQTAKISGPTLVDFQPSGSGRFNNLPTSIVRLTMRGKYASICEFIKRLKETGRLYRITQLSLQPVDRTNAEYDLRLELQWYQQPAAGHGRS